MSEMFANRTVSYPVGLETEFANLLLQEYVEEDGTEYAKWEDMRDPIVRAAANVYLPEHLQRAGGFPQSREFTSDGARYSVDHNHFETARPLCTTLRGAVIQFIVGQENAYDAFEKMKQEGRIKDFILSLRLIDNLGKSWGYHENYMMRRESIHRIGAPERDWEKFWPLSLRLATSALSGGAGCIFDGKYYYSQKALTLGKDVSSSTTSDQPLQGKPLLNIRDRPLANGNKYFRMHVVSRDALIDPLAHFRELGITSLVIGAIEAQIPMRDMRPRGPKFMLAKHIAGDMTMQRTVQLQAGISAHPYEIEEELINAARVLNDRYELSEELQLSLAMWESVHERGKKVAAAGKGIKDPRDVQEAVHEAACNMLPDVVWAQRLHVLRADYAKNTAAYGGVSQDELFRTVRAERIDHSFDRIDDPKNPRGSIGMKLRLLPQVAGFMPSRHEIDDAKYGLPDTPRERQRAEFIRVFAESENAVVSWDSVRHGNMYFPLSEPLQEDLRLTEYLRRTEAAEKVA